MRNIDKAIEILGVTNDGNDLAPPDLSLLEAAVNDNLTELGEEKFAELYDQVKAGTYKKPWYCGVENITQNHEGYIFWKGQEIEHHSYRKYDDAKGAAEELARRCMILETTGKPINTTTVVWQWEG